MLSTAELKERIAALADRYPRRSSALLPALDLCQRDRGGAVPREDLPGIADALGLPVSRVYGAWTYYSLFNQREVGRYHLQVDTNLPALLAGAQAILDHLRKVLGIGPGETTADGRYTLSTVEDLGSGGTCPVIQVGDRYYENMTVERVDELLACLDEGVEPAWPSATHVHSECNLLLRGRTRPGGGTLEAYRADGGYRALAQARGMEPAAVVAEVEAAELRGRGGAGFPAGRKWGFLPADPGGPVYLVCNADEGEPGTFKDRQIMEHDPHLLLEGMAIAAHAIGAARAFIYIRGEFARIAGVLEGAIADAVAAGVLGPEAGLEILVHRGAGAYVCGEETALLESLEGKRGQPRLKPPFPARAGLYGRPTIVNNVETLANLPFILRHGAKAYRRLGRPGDRGPKLFCVSGHVSRPGVYEYPMGVRLDTVLAAAGGVRGELKGVIVGGLSAPILTGREAAGLRLDFDSCARAGTLLGSGGIMVIAEDTPIPPLALRAIRFYCHESCGQCTPCREGTRAVAHLLERIVAGRGEEADLDVVVRLCEGIGGTTLCPAGDAFAAPVLAMVTRFRDEFLARVRRRPGGGAKPGIRTVH